MPQIIKIGGVVRDELLGVKSKDIDFTFVLDDLNKTVEEGFKEMETWMTDRGFKIFTSKPSMFTIRAKFPSDHIHTGLDADFVMARKELGYIPNTREPILALGTLQDDMMRRDFTINAMGIDEKGNLIDLFNGQQDLKNMILKTPLDPKITFMDDPLRILRCLRFHITRGFRIDDEVIDAMKQEDILEKLRTVVSAERVRDELFKMLKHDTPKTIRLINKIDENIIPGFLDLVFSRGLWAEPTFKL